MLQLNDNTESESSTAAGRVFEKSEIGIPVPKIAENRKTAIGNRSAATDNAYN